MDNGEKLDKKMDEILKLAGQIPSWVVDGLEKMLDQYPIGSMFCVAQTDDGVMLGDFMYKLYKASDSSVTEYLCTDDGQLVDSGKLQLAIIALNERLIKRGDNIGI